MIDPAEVLRIATPLIESFEGYRSAPYLCSAGVPTIGFGSTRYADGRRVTMLDAPISVEKARALLTLTLERDYLSDVLRLCPGADTPHRCAALVSFAYNLGSKALESSTLRKRVNQQDWPNARLEILRWVRAGGRVLPGLVKRREAESAML